MKIHSRVFKYIQLALEQHGCEQYGPLICGFFPLNMLEHFLEICNNLKTFADKPHNLEILKKIKRS